MSALAAVAIIALALWLQPGLQVPWLRVSLTPVAVAAVLGANMAIHLVIPPRWDVRTTRLSVQHGQAVTVIRPEQILDLLIQSGNRPALILRHVTRRGKQRDRRAGISKRVNIERLEAIAGQLLRERDRRVPAWTL